MFKKGHTINKGRSLTPEIKAKISAKSKGVAKSIQMRRLMSIAMKGNQNGKGLIGTHKSPEHRQKLRESLWRIPGGIISEYASIRNSIEYKLWRKAVFERDGYLCIWGGKAHGSKLEADHIKSFAHYPELRFAIDNGRTLCKDCHKTTDTYAGRGRLKS